MQLGNMKCSLTPMIRSKMPRQLVHMRQAQMEIGVRKQNQNLMIQSLECCMICYRKRLSLLEELAMRKTRALRTRMMQLRLAIILFFLYCSSWPPFSFCASFNTKLLCCCCHPDVGKEGRYIKQSNGSWGQKDAKRSCCYGKGSCGHAC